MKSLDCRLGWLAGIVDGEGSFQARLSQSVRTRRGGSAYSSLVIRFILSNTDEAMILETSSILDTIGVKYFVQYYQQPNPRCKPAWWLEVKGKEQIERFISSVQPYLVTKRAHADLLIRLIARRRAISLGAGYKTTVPMVTDKEILSILMGVKKLNRRGIGHGDVVEPTLSEPSRVVLGSVGSPLEGVVGADREREMNPHPAMGTTSSGVL